MVVSILKFLASDPFPLVQGREPTEIEAQSHAAQTDAWLGLRVSETEGRLNAQGSRQRAPARSGEHQQLWFGLEEQKLLTPYTDIRSVLDFIGPLAPESIIVDLGAAYGRIGFVVQRHHPEVFFIGYEYVGERVEEGRRCLRAQGCDRSRLEHADLTSPRFRLEAAQVYFIYDYGTPSAIEKTLYDLRKASLQKPFVLIGRGRHCRYMIESRHANWLTRIYPHRGEGRISAYASLGHPLLASSNGVEANM
jgi:hypothetical protein